MYLFVQEELGCMRKICGAVLILLFISTATATSIESENVTVDTTSSNIEVNLDVRELTSNSFNYLTSYPVENVEARINGRPADCSIESLQVGSEISCDTSLREDFKVNMNFTGSELIEDRNNIHVFRYTQSIYRPTDVYRLRLLLPQGSGLISQENSNAPVVSPSEHEIGSDGQQIYVEWEQNPQLGNALEFKAMYEGFSRSNMSILKGIAVLLLLATAGTSSYIFWNRKDKSSIESLYDDLTENQEEVIELLRKNEGEMLQKDVVEATDYSKAKISGVVSELVEKELVEKEKEGRSNKLAISKEYSF